MKTNIQDKSKLVNDVFDSVYKKYDFMNDVMSLGVHRIWKNNMITWMRPQSGDKIIDVASGTGDLPRIISKRNNGNNEIFCVEPNKKMLEVGKERLENYKNIKWFCSSAEKLPFNDNSFDFYTISFGIRNVNDINGCLKEAYRVLKSGGRFMCLEFSKIENNSLNLVYKNYSKVIPFIGKYIVGSSKPYNYLISSIENFCDQKKLVNLVKENGFSNIEFRNLSGGISAIHSGWKI